MVNQAVIVALPPALDPIRLAGDEEKHATIMYFGDTASLPDGAKTTILESIATAANMFTPFAEETMGTERLGSDVPPALVTRLSGRCLPKIRDALQINPDLVTYMGNAPQYPTYQPHVTLGYPDWQGEADLKKLVSSLYEVRFDRLALWWNDERFEFELGAKDRGMARAMSHYDRLRVNSFLEHLGVNRDTLAHAEETVQDVYNSMSEDQKDLAAVVIGAGLEDVDIPGDIDLQAIYDTYSPNQKLVLDYISGGVDSVVEHSDMLSEEFLAHFGVKGMKWGVRKNDSTALSKNVTSNQRAIASAAVKAGTGTLQDAHVAGLKTTGHRAINAFLGDKTFWKRTAIIAGISTAGIAASIAVPGLLPTAMLVSVGNAAYGPAFAALAGGAANLGAGVLAATGISLTVAGGAVAGVANVGTNAARAFRGNARINKSYEKMGKQLIKHQRTGNEKVQKVLRRNGSLRKKHVVQAKNSANTIDRDPEVFAAMQRNRAAAQHTAMDRVDNFLEHFGVKGMKWGTRKESESVWPSSHPNFTKTPAERNREAIDDFIDKYALFKPSPKSESVWPSSHPNFTKTPAERNREAIDAFIDKYAMYKPSDLQHMDDLMQDGNFLEHFGVKGMKWGVRRQRDSGGGSSGSSKADEKSDKKAQKDMDKMPVGSVVPVKNADGSTKLLLKKKDGSWRETYVSVDAEKFIRAREKAGHELSDRELKETLERARQVEKYNDMFGTGDHVELKKKVEQLQLQKQYKDLDAQLNPPKKSMVKKFIAGSGSAYKAYQELDNITGGAMSKQIKNSFAQAGMNTGKNSPLGKKFAAGQQKQSTPGPKTKGFRGKTPPSPWASSSSGGRAAWTNPSGVRIQQNPLFKANASKTVPTVPNITTLGKSTSLAKRGSIWESQASESFNDYHRRKGTPGFGG